MKAPGFVEASMHQHHRTKGFVLTKKNSGEADQIFVLYTQDFGKIELVGKAIRKITSKLKSSIDVFYFIEAEFIQGKKQKILTDAIVIEKFLKLRKNQEALACVSQISQAVCLLIPTEKKDDAIWSLLFEAITKINDLSLKIENYKLKIILNYFVWNFFALLGFLPELYNCPVCLTSLLPETFFLSPCHGGIICWRCCKKAKQENKLLLVEEISVNAVKTIRFLLKEPFEKCQKLTCHQKDIKDLEKLGELYFNFLS